MNKINEGKILFVISHYPELVVKKIEMIKKEFFEKELIEIYNALYTCVNDSIIIYPLSFYSNVTLELLSIYKNSSNKINISRIIKIILSLYNR